MQKGMSRVVGHQERWLCATSSLPDDGPMDIPFTCLQYPRRCPGPLGNIVKMILKAFSIKGIARVARITERIDGVIEKYLDEQGGENEVNMKVVGSTREAIRDTHLNLNAKRHNQ
ncbi:hypothetical protein RUM44_005427, partial [Polyplax serrata]